MFSETFYRNARARDLLDSFLISSITSVLAIRFYLHITGYPQLGGGTLQIAHVLWGGILMMGAIVIMLTFLGKRSRQIAAITGGLGFGAFIDELGKFITADNDYFFKPTIGLIYAVFVVLYLLFNFLTRAQRLSDREYHINVLNELEEAIAHDMDKRERSRMHALLDASDQKLDLTLKLRKLVDSLDITASAKQSRLRKLSKKIDRIYASFWDQRGSKVFIGVLFFTYLSVLVGGVVLTVYASANDITDIFYGKINYGKEALILQVGSSIIAGAFLIYGLVLLGSSRAAAFEQFRRAALISIYLTQVFVFIRLQFAALPGFMLNLIVLVLISFVLEQEMRLGRRRHVPSKR